MNKVKKMFDYEGKTTKLIGHTRTKTYNELYDHISLKQENKELPFHGDYLGDNELAHNIYETNEPLNLIGRQEQTLRDILAVEPIFDKVCRAKGEKLPFFALDKVADLGLELEIISKDEAEQLKAAEIGRLQVINVDDFDPADLLAVKAAHTIKKVEAA